MKAIDTLKHFFEVHHHPKVKEEAESTSKVQEYLVGGFCFLMFLALGPFAAIPTFFATFSIPKWLEEERESS